MLLLTDRVLLIYTRAAAEAAAACWTLAHPQFSQKLDSSVGCPHLHVARWCCLQGGRRPRCTRARGKLYEKETRSAMDKSYACVGPSCLPTSTRLVESVIHVLHGMTCWIHVCPP